MAAKPKNKSVGDTVKKILVDTAKGTAKDILMFGTVAGPGKFVKGAQVAGKVATKVAEKVVNKSASRAAEKVGMGVGKRIAETTPVPKYPSAKGKPVKIQLEGKSTVTSKSGSKSISANSSKVEGTKKAPTEGQRLGSFKAQDTKRTKAIVRGANTAAKEAKPVIVKEKIKTGGKAIAGTTAVVGPTAYVAGKNSDKKKKGK